MMTSINQARWIVGVDGSASSTRALEWALLNAGSSTEIMAVRAWTPPVYAPVPIDPSSMMALDDAASEAATVEHTRRLVDAAPNPRNLPVSVSVRVGGAAPVLLEAASDADLLIMGNRGHGGFARLLLGSVSSQCATHATVPTVVVPGEKPTEIRSALVAFDGSDNSIAALVATIGLVDPMCPIVALGVMEPGTVLIGYSDRIDEVDRQFNREHEAAFQRALTTAHASEGQVERRFEHGEAIDVLSETASDHDLVVVGARGHGAVASALLGSVSNWMLHHVTTPTMVVPAATSL